MTTTAQIAKRGCTGTGITEELAKLFHDQLGKTGVAIIEFVSDARGEKRDGDENVTLKILTVEVAPTPLVEDYLRNMNRALHFERKLGEDGPQLMGPDDGPEPTVKDVIAQGAGVLVEDTDTGEPRLYDPENDDPDMPAA